MDPVLYLPTIVSLFIAGWWALSLWRYPDRPPPGGLVRLPIEWTRTRWRAVAVTGIVAGIATALVTYLIASS
jgi:hypothetical protein